MEAATDNSKSLEARVARALRDAGRPLRAAEIAASLATPGTPGRRPKSVSKDAVNRVLCRGPFVKTECPGAPTWLPREQGPGAGREGHFAFQVDGVGLFFLRDELDREAVGSILTAA